MSVLPSDIVVYGSVNMPEADSATVGGAVDFTKRCAWYDLSANDTIDAVSSSASDTATNLRVMGRSASGVVVTSSVATLTGQTPITNVGTLGTVERMLAAVITGGAVAGLSSPGCTAAVGDVAVYRHTPVLSARTAQTGAANASGGTPALFKLQSGDGASVSIGQIIRIKINTGANQLRQIIATSGYGTDFVAVNRNWGTVPDNTSTYDVNQGILFEILPNAVMAVTRCFATAAADAPGGSSRTYYEKVFVVNNNTATALLSATVQDSSNTPTLSSRRSARPGIVQGAQRHRNRSQSPNPTGEWRCDWANIRGPTFGGLGYRRVRPIALRLSAEFSGCSGRMAAVDPAGRDCRL